MELDHTLAHLHLERSYIVSTLKSQILSNEQRNSNALENDTTLKRKVVMEKKKDFQQLFKRKKNRFACFR